MICTEVYRSMWMLWCILDVPVLTSFFLQLSLTPLCLGTVCLHCKTRIVVFSELFGYESCMTIIPCWFKECSGCKLFSWRVVKFTQPQCEFSQSWYLLSLPTTTTAISIRRIVTYSLSHANSKYLVKFTQVSAQIEFSLHLHTKNWNCCFNIKFVTSLHKWNNWHSGMMFMNTFKLPGAIYRITTQEWYLQIPSTLKPQ